MSLVALRSDNAYFGLAKQSVQGTAVAPTLFPRWMDGTSIDIDLKAEDIWEGDGSRRLSQIIKNSQQVKLKLVCTPRPNEVGLFEQAAMGASSDTYTAPSTGTSIVTSGTNSAGATTLVITATTGLTASGTYYVVVDPGLATEEIVDLTTPKTSGSGPYTFTIANSGTLQFTHTAGAVVEGPANHVLVDMVDGSYYTIEVSIGGTSGDIFRVKDCKLDSIKRSAKSGSALMYELEFIGLSTTLQVSAASTTFDPHNIFLYTQGVWTLDGSTSSTDALNIDLFDISQKNNCDWVQTELLIGSSIIFAALNLDVGLQVAFSNPNKINQVYFGGASGTTDQQAVATGSIILLFTQADNFNTLQYSTPALTYTKAAPPTPKADGKAWRLPISSTSTSAMSANTYLLQTTVTNTKYAAY